VSQWLMSEDEVSRFSASLTQELVTLVRRPINTASVQLQFQGLLCMIMSAADVGQPLSSSSRFHSRPRSATSPKCDGSPTPVPSPDAERLLINSMQFVESPKKSIVPNHILDTSMSYLV